MTNFEHFKSMSIEELAKWLGEYGQFEKSPWATWFSETYCNECESIKCKYEDAEKTLGFTSYAFGYSGLDCAYCEVEKKCKFFPNLDDTPDNLETIKMWLNKEAE